VTTTTVERSRPPLAGDERTLLTAFLDFHRDTVRVRCLELPTGSTHTMPTPLVRPVDLVAHLRWLEHFWCEVVLAGRSSKAPYTEQEPEAGFRVPEGASLAQVLEDYERQCESSRRVLAELDLDYEVEWHDRRTNVRWVFLHLIEETARHNGHLDAVRELITSPSNE
jgi:hypothetical protein